MKNTWVMLFDHVQMPAGCDIGLSAADPFVENVGASSGPRIVTCAFNTRSWRSGWEPRLTFAAELDHRVYQDATSIRRRTARALVPMVRRFADAILSDTVKPDLELRSATTERCVWSGTWTFREQFEGLARRAVVTQDFSLPPTHEHLPPPIDEPVISRITEMLRNGAKGLHVAVDDPANGHLFGRT